MLEGSTEPLPEQMCGFTLSLSSHVVYYQRGNLFVALLLWNLNDD